MAKFNTFVGRKTELDRFGKVLTGQRGQAIVVVGQAGMGKTWLVNRMANIAREHTDFKCGVIRYEITKTDTCESRLALMMDDAFAAAGDPGKFLGLDNHGKKQWATLFNALKIFPGIKETVESAQQVTNLVKCMKREPAQDTRDQFIGKMSIISSKMPDNGRAIFIIDPEKYMQADSDEAWASVIRRLPDKIIIIFAQRPEDVLVESEMFRGIDNVVRIPQEGGLEVLDEISVEQLFALRADEVGCPQFVLSDHLVRYKGHPYALQAALDLVKTGTKLDTLPDDPTHTKIAITQWKKVQKAGPDAIALFEAYAILEVAVSQDLADYVGVLDSKARKSILADDFLHGLLRLESAGRRIYHSILADHILSQIGDDESKEYHRRATEVYFQKLKTLIGFWEVVNCKLKLSWHIRFSEGEDRLTRMVVDEWIPIITKRGFGEYHHAIRIVKFALELVTKGSKNEAELKKIESNLLGIYHFGEV